MAVPIRDRSLVDLVVTGGERHAVRVQAVRHDHLAVRLFEQQAGFPVDVVAGAIESVSSAGVTRVEGTLSLAADRQTVHFQTASADDTSLRRRRFPRGPLDRECVLSPHNGTSCAGRIVDISSGGMLVYAAEVFGLEHVVRFALPWQGDDAAITGHARCIRESVDGAYAFEFSLMPANAQRKLRELIASAGLSGLA